MSKNTYLGAMLAIGAGAGSAIGVALGNLIIGILMGLAIFLTAGFLTYKDTMKKKKDKEK